MEPLKMIFVMNGDFFLDVAVILCATSLATMLLTRTYYRRKEARRARKSKGLEPGVQELAAPRG